ncbi:MAG: leucine-rich repeat domain-containing protein [Oscillospiraceae bacterium]|nr:leucine-rich repeat domain-containing protein [Oscillospiraceae bacterium]
MNFKKIAALFSATTFFCLSAFPTVSAEEATTEATEEITIVEENVLSEDSLWNYSLIKNNLTAEEYISLESYNGTENEVSIPSEVDGNIVRELGDYTFYENPAIKKITIPETISYFGNFPFFACSSLTEFEVDGNNDNYSVKDGILMDESEQVLVCFPPARTDTEFVIPDGVTELGSGAFATCTNLTSITFPDTLQTMGLYCFAECTSLNNVVIPESVTELSQFNFTGCTSLTNITLPDTMSIIGDGAFFSCTSLNSFEFPAYIQEIGQCAFTSTGFTEIEIPPTVQKIGYSAFGYTADQQGQIVAMDSFIIKGLTGSVAQSYCAENEHVTFESTDDSSTDATTEADKDSKSDKEKPELKKGVIAAIAIVGVVVIAGVIIVIIKFKKSKSDDDTESEISDEETENKE